MHRGQFAGAAQAGQLHRIAPVGLQLVSASFGDERGATTVQSMPQWARRRYNTNPHGLAS
jgi:hypothetical protein